ncbi:hypothetical protein B0I18_107202 [Taibaiella chishuiensis]|uniref:Uncharacterized protein n=2 Tax=Taibaiella chishuiensis TaxID=1434707 RepID=A0A2P8D0N9_9BACT|nr:hypothetical protein B0I18_107202 [Taibaiella chishuiensis]
MGYRAEIDEQRQNRELPRYLLGASEFLVDLLNHEFRQADNPHNRISLGDVKEEYGFSILLYDTITKNRFLENVEGVDLPGHVQLIIVPPLKDLDPVGLARRQGKQDDYYIKEKRTDIIGSLITFRKSKAPTEQKKRKGISR